MERDGGSSGIFVRVVYFVLHKWVCVGFVWSWDCLGLGVAVQQASSLEIKLFGGVVCFVLWTEVEGGG